MEAKAWRRRAVNEGRLLFNVWTAIEWKVKGMTAEVNNTKKARIESDEADVFNALKTPSVSGNQKRQEQKKMGRMDGCGPFYIRRPGQCSIVAPSTMELSERSP